jgi:hypothetical protein
MPLLGYQFFPNMVLFCSRSWLKKQEIRQLALEGGFEVLKQCCCVGAPLAAYLVDGPSVRRADVAVLFKSTTELPAKPAGIFSPDRMIPRSNAALTPAQGQHQ